MSNKKILCFVDYYTPGFKAGGPIKTISNMVNVLGRNNFNFLIFTRNHDLNSNLTYDSIKTNTWQKVGNAIVFYTKVNPLFFFRAYEVIWNTNADIIYLNSFFSKFFTIVVLFLLKLSVNKNSRIIIAPRGEFSAGALEFNKKLKLYYLIFFKRFFRNDNIYFQVSSEFEKSDLLKLKFNSDRIFIAPNLISGTILDPKKLIINKTGVLRVVFFSRISPMKNLYFLLEILLETQELINFEICGPIEDTIYWDKCLLLINQFPPNIKFKYNSSINPNDVSNYLSSFDLLVLPTLGENFGHVIIESLCAGLPVLISDRTLWKSNDTLALTCIDLDDRESWKKALVYWAKMSADELLDAKYLALGYADSYLNSSISIKQNISLFSI